MQFKNQGITATTQSHVAMNAVLKNTYFLLSLTLLFSAAAAAFAVITNAPPLGWVLSLVGMFGLLFLTRALRNSPWGIVSAFLFTGFMGYMLGPNLNLILHNYANGAEIIATSLSATGAIFLALSGYVLISKKDFSYMGGFIAAGFVVAFIVGIGAALFNMPMLQLIISGAFALLASGMILFETSQIVKGGENNYIMATISLYVALFNLFVSLLQILSAFSGNRN